MMCQSAMISKQSVCTKSGHEPQNVGIYTKDIITVLEQYKDIFTHAQSQLKNIDPNYIGAFDEQHLENTMHTLRVCTDDIEEYSKSIERDKASKEVYEHVLSGERPKHELLVEYNRVKNMPNEDAEDEILYLYDNITSEEHEIQESHKEFSTQTSTIMDCLKPLQDKANTLMNDGGISKRRFRKEQATKNSEIEQLQSSVPETKHEIEQLQSSVPETNHEIEQLQERVSKIETQESAFQRATEQDPQSSQDFQNLTPFIELTGSKDVRASLDKALRSYKAHKQHQFLESSEHENLNKIARQVEDRRHQLYMEVTPEKYPEQYKMSQDYRLRLNFQEVLTSDDSD